VIRDWADARAQAIIAPLLKPLIGAGISAKRYDELWNAVAAELRKERAHTERVEALLTKTEDFKDTF
jgi:hypothetical protein